MSYRHVYFDGCNGDKNGDHVDDPVDWILEYTADWKYSKWTKEMAKDAVKEGDIIILDYDGDQQERLVPC